MSIDKPESYAQWGDDVLAWEYFKGKTDGVFLEAGANHPTILSQTYLLEKRGWTGVLVEPVPECCEKLRAGRPGSRVFQKALGSPSQRGVLKLVIPGGHSELASALKEGGAGEPGDTIFEAELITLTEVLDAASIEKLNFLSLDLEGMELEALQGLDFQRFRPELIIVEDRLDRLSRHRFLKENGYKLVRRNGSNNWYIPKEHPYDVPFVSRLGWFRKFQLSMPFRRFRDFSRKIRGKG